MTENPTDPTGSAGSADSPGHYDVVLLVEEELSDTDARQVRSLHVGVEETVRYHLLLPVEDAAARVEAAMGSMGATGEVLAPPAVPPAEVDLTAVREQSEHRTLQELTASVAAIEAAGGLVGSRRAVDEQPVEALAAVVAEVDAREAIIVTRRHVVAEFLHLDWTSKARRHVGVPLLHLVEHETFDEQAGGGEGVSGA